MSVLNSILDEVVAIQDSLALKVESKDLRNVKRKLPKREERIDLSFQVTVNGSERVDQVKRIGFGQRWQVLYNVEITLITPGDRDAAQNLPDHAAWREATRAWYQKAQPFALAAVQRVEIVDAAFLDRSQLAAGYDYNQVALQVTTYEDRSS